MPRARAGIVLSHYVRDVQAFKIKDTFLNDEIARPTISRSTSPSLWGGGGVTPLRAPTPLCQNRVCLTRGVSPGAYRGVQGS